MFDTRTLHPLALHTLALCLGAVLCAWSTAPAQPPADDRALERWVAELAARLPLEAEDFRDPRRIEPVREAARAIDGWAAVVGRFDARTTLESLLSRVERLVVAQAQVDQRLDQLLALRRSLLDAIGTNGSLEPLRHYLQTANVLYDLSGRLRYTSYDVIYDAAVRVASRPDARDRLIALLARHRSAIGADVMSWALFDPPANSPNNAQPASPQTKARLLQFIAASGNWQLVPRVARFALQDDTPDELVVLAAEGLRDLGLPQDPRPGDTAAESQPPITAAQLQARLSRVAAGRLTPPLRRVRDELLVELAQRARHGLPGDRYRLGTIEVQAGDWLLMRNPSPYNLFTELAPGLFTHVGVATVEQGSDGIRRMVIVDLPERGTHIPATNVEVFVNRTRHFLFLRHPDADTARAMAQVAQSIIGNESVFDLHFRIANIAHLKGRPKRGEVIETYCAGLLLLCAQETQVPRERLFPVTEQMAGGRTSENLARLGITFGEDFVSPSGALFSPELQIAGRSPPMYDPQREVEEAIFDHFAHCLRTRTLNPQHDAFTQVRTTLAAAAANNPALARLLAQLNNVDPRIDLQTAAKTAAVVELLDRVAYGHSETFVDALFAVTTPDALQDLSRYGYSAEEIARLQALRAAHRDLYEALVAGRLSERQVRMRLVDYYAQRGKAELERHFE
jgi:hypothetical protein